MSLRDHLDDLDRDVDDVLVRGSTTAQQPTAHLPDPDDPRQPRCPHGQRETQWFSKDPAILDDDTELCPMCRGVDFQHDGGPLGPYQSLQDANPEDLGLSALGDRPNGGGGRA